MPACPKVQVACRADFQSRPLHELSDDTRDMHRAITSLMEELEAVDWYNQRVDACKDPELKANPGAQPR